MQPYPIWVTRDIRHNPSFKFSTQLVANVIHLLTKVNDFSSWYHWHPSYSLAHRLTSLTHQTPNPRMPPGWTIWLPCVADGSNPICTWDALYPISFPPHIFPSACLIPAIGHVVSYTESNAINVSAPGATITDAEYWSGTQWSFWTTIGP